MIPKILLTSLRLVKRSGSWSSGDQRSYSFRFGLSSSYISTDMFLQMIFEEILNDEAFKQQG
jgi:hypothetical protein